VYYQVLQCIDRLEDQLRADPFTRTTGGGGGLGGTTSEDTAPSGGNGGISEFLNGFDIRAVQNVKKQLLCEQHSIQAF